MEEMYLWEILYIHIFLICYCLTLAVLTTDWLKDFARISYLKS